MNDVEKNDKLHKTKRAGGVDKRCQNAGDAS